MLPGFARRAREEDKAAEGAGGAIANFSGLLFLFYRKVRP